MPGKLKLTIYQGATFRKKFEYTAGNLPVILTGSKITLEIAPADLSAKITYSTETGHVVIDGPLVGKFFIRIPPATTAGYTWQTARYNLLIEYPNGDITRLLEGGVAVSRRI
jgi:hypothetical protein